MIIITLESHHSQHMWADRLAADRQARIAVDKLVDKQVDKQAGRLVADMFADRLVAGRFVGPVEVDTEVEVDKLFHMKVDMSAESKLSGAGCCTGCTDSGKAPYIHPLFIYENDILSRL